MADPRSLLQREMERIALRPFTLDGFYARRDRKRRNQRILAGVVGIALFVVPVALIAVLSSRDRTETPAGRSASRVPEVDYVIDLNTGVMTPLPESIIRSLGGSVLSGHYAVSPDGYLLAYVGLADDGNPQIFIAGIDGTGVRQVTHEPNGATRPAWSPDGAKIAYEGSDNRPTGNGHIFVLDVATGESTILETPGLSERSPRLFEGDPQFTPDGSSLLYTGLESYNLPLAWTVPIAGGESTLLFPLRGGLTEAENASLSPDGSLVTFLDGRFHGPPGPRRWVANADGTGLRELATGCASSPPGTWSPDGSRIVCWEGNSVIVVDIATGDASTVAEGRGAIWLDDHTLLVEV